MVELVGGIPLLQLSIFHYANLIGHGKGLALIVGDQYSRRSLLMEGKLNTVAAVFLPLTAVGGIFGMNLVSGLEASSWAFWAIFAGGLLVGLVLRGWAGREPRSSDRPQR